MTYEQTLHNGLAQMNANLRSDEQMKMPKGKTPKQSKVQKGVRKHAQREQTLGDVSEHLLAMIHKAIPMDQALKIQAASDAVEAEWVKLEEKRSWAVDLVQNRKDVQARAWRDKVTIHFGSLKPLCHQKNAEQAEKYRSYKGRVIFRGHRQR